MCKSFPLTTIRVQVPYLKYPPDSGAGGIEGVMPLVKHPTLTAQKLEAYLAAPLDGVRLKKHPHPKAGMSHGINNISQKGGLHPKLECPLDSTKGGLHRKRERCRFLPKCCLESAKVEVQARCVHRKLPRLSD